MSLQIATNINVDFYDNKYIMINAKQYDSSSRWVTITCYDNGKLFNLNASKHTAYIRYRKADGNSVLNSCRINYKGEVLVELTERMLSADGICYVDLIVVNKGSAIVNIDTGEIIAVDDSEILSTMAFCVNVYEASVDNSLIELTYENEVNALNELLENANAEYREVYQLARSWAIGDANDIRENEDYDNSKYYSRVSKSYAVGDADGIRTNENNDNAKYYYEKSLENANSARESRNNAMQYANDAANHRTNAENSSKSAGEYMLNTSEYMTTTEEYMNLTKTYMESSSTSMQEAKKGADEAKESADEAEGWSRAAASIRDRTEEFMNQTRTYMNNASDSSGRASDSAYLARSYAIGGTTKRENEDTDNAKYYYEMSKAVANGLNNGFIPIGTITFSELAAAEKATGYTYNISDDFITDETFAEGAGHQYTAGTNVYCRSDGLWDCFGGAVTPIATVDEVKSYLGI